MSPNDNRSEIRRMEKLRDERERTLRSYTQKISSLEQSIARAKQEISDIEKQVPQDARRRIKSKRTQIKRDEKILKDTRKSQQSALDTIHLLNLGISKLK